MRRKRREEVSECARSTLARLCSTKAKQNTKPWIGEKQTRPPLTRGRQLIIRGSSEVFLCSRCTKRLDNAAYLRFLLGLDCTPFTSLAPRAGVAFSLHAAMLPVSDSIKATSYCWVTW